jgi:hypothetical protein
MAKPSFSDRFTSFILHVQVEDLCALERVVERLSPFGQTRTAIVLSTSVDKFGRVPLPEDPA